MIIIPEDVERMVEKLEKHKEIETPFALAQWMKKKGYKMPEKKSAAQDIIDGFLADVTVPTRYEPKDFHLPTPREEHDFKHAKKQIHGKIKALGEDGTITPHYKESKPVAPVTKLSPKEDVESYLHLHQKAGEEDMLVFPDEFKMGMKEELEHKDVIGDDKEALKKIVLAHLKEDPHYYTKLGTVMKAEEAFSPYSKQDIKEHKSVMVNAPAKGKPMQRLSTTPKQMPPKSKLMSPKTQQLRQQFAVGKPKSQTVTTTPIQKSLGVAEEKADETSDYIKSVHTRKMPGWTAPKGPKPKTEQDLPSERLSAEEGKEVDVDALNELYMFMKWMSDKGFKADDKEKLDQYMDQYDVEKFAEKAEQLKQSDSDKLGEEKQAPAKFHAEPEEAGVMDKAKTVLKDFLPLPKPKENVPHISMTKKTMGNVVRKIKSGV